MRQRLLRLVPGDQEPSVIQLPFDGQFDLVDGDARIDGVLLRDRRWTTRSRYWVVRDGVVSELPIVPIPPDGIELTAEEVAVPSVDGMQIGRASCRERVCQYV